MVTVWICLCAYLNCTGWALSGLHALNRTGYAAAFALAAMSYAVWRKGLGPKFALRFNLQKQRRRFTRLFPAAFLVLAALAILGGALYAPNNYDGLAYRTPRVLHWLAEGRWHWIHTSFHRLNVRAVAFEWVSAPLIALTRTDRWLFLIEAVSFLFLPGLLFSVFTRLGVRPRVAWHWMWLVPTGYCYLLQAGSIGNDLFGAVFALAALDFALRAQTSHAARDFWLSILAAALVTGSKSSNLPLLLPWLVAIVPSFRFLTLKPVSTLVVFAVAAACSLLPISWLNAKYCGDWTGVATESVRLLGNPLVCFANNIALFFVQNLVPPIFPFANAWNQLVRNVMPAAMRLKLKDTFEGAGAQWRLPEMQVEECAGLGFGVCLLLLASVVVAAKSRPAESSNQPPTPGRRLLRISLWLAPYAALGAFMAKSGLSTMERLIAPYYPLLLPALLAGAAHGRLVGAAWWRRTAMAVFLLAGVLLFVSPARPLWPAQWALAKLKTEASPNPLLARAQTVYGVYAERADGFARVRRWLPADAKVLGMVTFDDPETSLWRPFFSRRVEHVLATDTPADLQRRGVRYVLVGSNRFNSSFSQTFDQWLAQNDAEILRTIPLRLRASEGAVDWILVRLRRGETKGSQQAGLD